MVVEDDHVVVEEAMKTDGKEFLDILSCLSILQLNVCCSMSCSLVIHMGYTLVWDAAA